MKHCTRCRTIISEKTTLCPACGASLPLTESAIKIEENKIDDQISISESITDDTETSKPEISTERTDLDDVTDSSNTKNCTHPYKLETNSAVMEDVTDRNEKLCQLILALKVASSQKEDTEPPMQYMDGSPISDEVKVIIEQFREQSVNRLYEEMAIRERKDKLKRSTRIAAIWIATILLLSAYIATGYIKKSKARDKEKLAYYGGSKSQARESVAEYNKSIDRLNELTDSIINKNPHLFIYTNDTNIKYAGIYPNLDYDSFEHRGHVDPLISRNEQKIRAIDNFIGIKMIWDL